MAKEKKREEDLYGQTAGAIGALVIAAGILGAIKDKLGLKSGIELAQNCWQVFGGIAYTWEHDLHLYLRRLTGNASLYGDASWHRERVCALAGL